MHRRILTSLAIVASFFASLLVASPALAATADGQDVALYSSAGELGANAHAKVAISADGNRMLLLMMPTGVHGCASNKQAVEVRGGVRLASGQTMWGPSLWLSPDPMGSDCGDLINSRVMLSDDGRIGLVEVTGYTVQRVNVAFGLTRIQWAATDDWPSIGEQALASTTPASTYNPTKDLAITMSRDGRVGAMMFITAGPSGSSYAHLNFSITPLQGTSIGSFNELGNRAHGFEYLPPLVAMSKDGSLTAFSGGITNGDRVPDELDVYTCPLNCSVDSSYRNFTMSSIRGISSPAGGSLVVSDSGNRVALAWPKWGDPHTANLFVANPLATSAVNTDMTSKVVATNIAYEGGPDHFAMNEAGTKIAFSTGSAVATEASKITTADISATASVKNLVTKEIYPRRGEAHGKLSFVNALAGSPERLALITTGLDTNNRPSISVLLSNTATAPSNWAVVRSSELASGYAIQPSDFVVARSAPRFASTLNYSFDDLMSPVSYYSSVQVGELLKVLTPTVKPSVSGTPAYNKPLTASGGRWSTPGVSIAYAWLVDDTVVHATSTPTRFVPTLSSVRGQQVGVAVRVSKTGYFDSIIKVNTVGLVGGYPITPALGFQGALGSGGAPAVGNVVIYSTVGSNPENINTTAVWKVGTRNAGTGASYTVQAGDIGKKITLTVTFSGSYYKTATKTIVSKAIVRGTVVGVATMIHGNAWVDGIPLSIDLLNSWAPAGVTFTYVWKSNGVDVGHGATYTLTQNDVGHTIVVTVTGTKPGCDSATRDSVAFGPISPINLSDP